MLESLEIYLTPAIISYLWLLTGLGDVVYFHTKKYGFKKWIMFVVDKLSCSHCVTFWTSLVMLNGLDNLLLMIFVNIIIVKLSIKYT